MRFIAIFLLLLMLPFAAAYTLSLKITVSQDTIAPGTNITIVKEGVELAKSKADSKGLANFSLLPGSYFVILERGGYSRHVNLIDVGKDTSLTLVMRNLISYANAYGTISGPSDFSNTSVSAVAGGKVVKRAQADRNGYYLLQYLPEGTYELKFESPGFETKSMQAFLQQSQFFEANVDLAGQPQSNESAAQATLLVPSVVKLRSLIEVWLLDGDRPLAGKIISVETPGGEIKIETDAAGKARVNAATPGKYTFSYGGLKASTVIEGEKDTSQGASLPGNPTSGEQPQTPESQPGEPSQQVPFANAPILALGGMGVAAFALLIAILWAAAKIARGGKKPGGMEPPKEAPASGLPKAAEGSQPHAHARKTAHSKGAIGRKKR